jgi:4a-hydroxytetrahydrobiopterin dehydratase
MQRLNPKQIALRLKTVPQWERRAKIIRRKFEFKGFLDAISFVNRVARAAERNDHHPDIDIRWNKVTLVFTTHSKGGLTDSDFDSAEQVSRIFSRSFSPR